MVADATAAGGRVVGIIPQALVEREGVNRLHRAALVHTMHERKRLMAERADAFLACRRHWHV